jgi:tetratricopeptide (TPR) repeat protein/serine/threonine protein kinase
MNTDFERLRKIFLAIVDQPSCEWEARLDQACGDDLALRRQVSLLFKEYAEGEGILDRPRADSAATACFETWSEGPGTVIGPYKLMEQIGEGGMGLVFVAEQQHPVRRKVALKVIKPGMDTRRIVARFEAERQALALMDHPNIAKVHDGGETAGGRPYFVMELVKGVPITEYCDANRLAPRERLELFLNVCEAVLHAHQKGIIHRDIKPSNVLVTSHDGKPVVKVIDFGVAKPIGQQLTDKTVYTQFAQLIGTPLYMSPEQAEMSGLDIDTRSDIYSLGVLLYELLTGATPFDKERLKQASFDEIRRIIREEEPPKPSARMSTMGLLATTASEKRRSDPRRLSRLLRGELDWIVMKALEKDRNRRYESASALAADVQRFLKDEPVQACPPSATYRLRKFARRNKTALAIAGLILFFIALLGGGSGWFLGDRAARKAGIDDRAARALDDMWTGLDHERLPEAMAAMARAEAIVAAAEADEATRTRVREARELVDLMAELDDARFYSSTDPPREWNSEQDRRFKKIFDGLGIDVDNLSTDEAAERLTGHPLQRHLASALDSWANARLIIWSYEEQLDAEWWKQLLRVAARSDSDELRNRVRTAFLDTEDRRVLINGNSKTLKEMAASPDVGLLPAPTVILLARALYWGGDPERKEMAIRVLKQAHARQPDHFGLNMTLGHYLAFLPEPRKEEALSYFQAARAIRPQNRQVPAAIAGEVLLPLKRANEAIPILSAAIEQYPNDAMARNNRGAAYMHLNQLDNAIADCSKAVALDPNLAHAWINRSNAHYNKKSFDNALTDAEEAVKLSPNEAKTWGCRGLAYSGLGAWEKARDDFTQSIKLDGNWAVAWAGRARAYEELKEYRKAVNDYSSAIALDSADAESLSRRGFLYGQFLNAADKAVKDFNQAIVLDPKKTSAWLGLGAVHMDRKEWEKGIHDYSQVLELEPEKAETPEMARIWFQLGFARTRLARFREAESDYSKALALDPNFVEAWYNRGWVYNEVHQYEKAEADYTQAISRKPLNVDYLLARGIVRCDHLKQYDNAIKDFTEAIRLKKDLADAWYDLGWAYTEQGKYENAVANFSQAIALAPNYFKARMNRGVIYCDHLRQYDKAIEDFSKSVEIEPKNAMAHYNLGRALRGKGDLDGAIAAFQKSVRFNGDDAAVLNELGNALFDGERLDDAIEAYHKAIRIKKDEAKFHFNLGNAYVKKGRLDDAITEQKAAIQLRANFPEAYCSLGVALAMKGLLDNAIKAYEEAIRLKNDDPACYYNYGNALHAKGRLDDAIKAYEKAIQLKADDPNTFTAFGDTLRDRRRTDDAIAAYQKAIRLKDDSVAAHNGLAVALQDKNQLDEAIAEHKKAIQLNEKLPAPHNGLGVAYAKQNRMDDAIAEFRKAIALKSDFADGHMNLGNALHAKGDPDGAITAYKKSIEVDPKNAPAHYNLGNVLREKGDLTGAKAAYQRAIALQSDHVLAHWNLGLLLQKHGEFREALEELRRSRDLGSEDASWAKFAAEGVRRCERLIELEGRLPDFLEDKAASASPAERIELAGMCTLKRLHRAAARFYREAFTEKPELADDLSAWHRYSAACAAALAASGEGKDADKLDDKDRARLRRQALEWLRADLEARGRMLDKGSAAELVKNLRHWQVDPDLAVVRGAEALEKLPEAERQPWQKLWDDVADILARAQGKTK